MSFLIFQETSEKRKSAKRTLKSEKELLEFTLKYQQVLAERDAGMLQQIYPMLIYKVLEYALKSICEVSDQIIGVLN